jgi:hypothetical protein
VGFFYVSSIKVVGWYRCRTQLSPFTYTRPASRPIVVCSFESLLKLQLLLFLDVLFDEGRVPVNRPAENEGSRVCLTYLFPSYGGAAMPDMLSSSVGPAYINVGLADNRVYPLEIVVYGQRHALKPCLTCQVGCAKQTSRVFAARKKRVVTIPMPSSPPGYPGRRLSRPEALEPCELL